MSEITAVCRAWHVAARCEEPTFLATVVGVDGSSYRRPGARLLFSRDAVLAGAVSGGCLERELVRRGAWLARGWPVLETIDSRWDDDERATSGCHGKLELLIEPLSASSDAGLAMIARELSAERRVALATIVRENGALLPLGARVLKTERGLVTHVTDARSTRALAASMGSALGAERFRTARIRAGGAHALIEVLEPAPRLFVFGAGSDVVPVVRLADSLGWNVTVCAPPGRPALRDRFAQLAELSELRTAENVKKLDACARPLALVMSHDYDADREALGALLGSGASYVGVLGPAERTRRMLGELEATLGVVSALRRAAVFAPAGLALGAETPEEMALSIIAEAQATLTRSAPSPLAAVQSGIHELVPLEEHVA